MNDIIIERPTQLVQEPVAWMYDWDDEHGRTRINLLTTDPEHSHLQTAFNITPLYSSPQTPKQEPLSDREILKNTPHLANFERTGVYGCLMFEYGVRFAEKHHDIK